MQFKKIYIEITNSCNFNCSFCFTQRRALQFMPVEKFRTIAQKVKPFTDYIYLHVLGEPLLHPKFQEILKTASDFGFQVNLTTNGSLLYKYEDFLLQNPLRQINISVHDAEENIQKEKWQEYLISLIELAKKLAANSFINLRLWNSGHSSSSGFNDIFLQALSESFANVVIDKTQNNRNANISKNIHLQSAPRFEWRSSEETNKKTCYGLRDQIAILVNGDVVPCCIDAEANLFLGNIFREDLCDILNSEKAIRIKKGFEQQTAVESYCMKCGFRV